MSEHLDVDSALRLLASPDPIDRARVAADPDLTPQQVAEWCALERDPNVLAVWASHPNVGAVAERLRATGWASVIAALDANPAVATQASAVSPAQAPPSALAAAAPPPAALMPRTPVNSNQSWQPTPSAAPCAWPPASNWETPTLAGAVPELSAEALLKPKPPMPESGWRRAVWKASGGTIKPKPSKAEERRRALRAQANAPLPEGRAVRIAVVSTKGGIGKTTTAVMLGHTLAANRQDRVIAIDANPDMGTLGLRVPEQASATVRDLLMADPAPSTHHQIRSFTQLASTRLEVLASPPDPLISEAVGAEDYSEAIRRIEPFYNVLITDTGTGVLHDAMSAILATCDQLVLVAGTAADEARSTGAALTWLDRHGHDGLVSNAVVVVNSVQKRAGVDLDRITAFFTAHCRAVVTLPWDKTLFLGGTDTIDDLRAPTRDAYLQLAAAVAMGWGLRRQLDAQGGSETAEAPSEEATG